MSSPKQERALRRTVEQLSHCSMDDIEWIWSTLGTEQRRRLRPLLAEVRPGWRIEQQAGERIAAAHAPSGANRAPRQLAQLIRQLPTELARRVLACLDDTQRLAIVAQLPANLVGARHAEIRMTIRAQRSLRDAACTSANDMATLPASRQPTWRRLFQWKARA